MGIYLLQRLGLMLVTLLSIVVLNFAIIQIAPGGPVEQAIYRAEQMQGFGQSLAGDATAPEAAYRGAQGLSPEMIAQIKAQYGFDQPAYQRLWQMLCRYSRLDLGRSFFQDKPVLQLIKDKLPVSISLGLWSFLLVYVLAIPLGIYKAKHHGQGFDRISSVLLALAYALPSFVVALLLMLCFAGGRYWQWFPLQGLVSEHFAELSAWQQLKDYLWHLLLPVLTMTLGSFAGLCFLTKYAFLEELYKPYVLTARAQGLNWQQVWQKHIFRNAVLVLVAGLPEAVLGIFLLGNVFVEIIFNLDGLGLLAFEALSQRDYPVIFGSLFIYSLLGLLLRLLSDVLYCWIDPRIDFARRGAS
jgi:microcin C transport system permease protein